MLHSPTSRLFTEDTGLDGRKHHLIDRRSKCDTKYNAIIKCTSGEPDGLAFIILVIMCDYQINKLTASLIDIPQKNLSLHVALQRTT